MDSDTRAVSKMCRTAGYGKPRVGPRALIELTESHRVNCRRKRRKAGAPNAHGLRSALRGESRAAEAAADDGVPPVGAAACFLGYALGDREDGTDDHEILSP